MGIFEGCLLASDVDGTLESQGKISEKNIEKIHFFINEGGYFSLASGRGPEGIMPMVRRLGEISASVTSNGCVIYDTTNKKVLHGEVIPEEDKHFVLDVLKQIPGVGIEVHIGDKTYNVNRNKESDDHEFHEEIDAIFLDVKEIMDIPWSKVLYMPTNSQEMEQLIRISRSEKSSEFISSCANIEGTQRDYYEQVPMGVSKASALEKLKKIYNIKEGLFFAIGDYYNDLEMLSIADISAATAEAPQDIKDKCDYIACGCAEGAVGDFIDYLTEKFKNKGSI